MSTPKMKSFGTKLDAAIANGHDLTARLRGYIEEGLGLNDIQYQTKKNLYIQSFPGAGKTFLVDEIVKKNKLKPIIFGGGTSIYGFVMSLCYIAHWSEEEHVPIVLDDCLKLFSNEDNLEVMKDFFNPNHEFQWAKGINTSLTNGNQKMKQAIVSSVADGGIGVKFNTKKFSTLVLSNKPLASIADIKMKRVRKTKQADSESAIHSRIQYRAFSSLTDEENWGWLASIVLSTKHFVDVKGQPFNITPTEKFELLQYIHYNWNEISSPEMRTVTEFAGCMKRNPDGYLNDWELLLRGM